MTDTHHELHAVDLFCGAGGASEGLARAGFDVVAGVDKGASAVATHRENHDGQTIQHDLRDVNLSVLPARAKVSEYVHGSFVCKGSSPANHNASADDERNDLALSFLDWIEALQPAVWTIENVARFWAYRGDEVERRAERLGYRLERVVLNAANYGVPQTRDRLFVIAVDESLDTNVHWPERTHSETPYWTLSDRRVEEFVGVVDALDLEWPKVVHKGSGATSPANWRPGSAPSHTVTGQGNNVVAPADDPDAWRQYTVDELARLQGFPEDYEFVGNKTEKQMQIGNAVPPALMEAVATTARDALVSAEPATAAKQDVIA